MKLESLLSIGLLLCSTLNAQTPSVFEDSFTAETLHQRKALRGPWKIGGGDALCTQDDELYKKFKNHGPILIYDLPFQDGEVSFSYRPDQAVKNFVFTLNAAKGHLYRFVTSGKNTTVRAYVIKEGAEKPDSLPVGEAGPPLKPGEWTRVSIVIAGSKATLKIGDNFTTTAEHASYMKDKATISLGFSFGTVGIKDFKIVKK
jgi:hypothetical protein